MYRKIVSFILCIAMAVAGVTVLPAASYAAGSGPDLSTVRGSAYLKANNNVIETVDTFHYSDEMFTGSSLQYNNSLATTSLEMAAASLMSNREPNTPEGYANKMRNIRAFLEDNGFTGYAHTAAYGQNSPDPDAAAVAFAHKKIRDNGREYTLLALVPRSGTHGHEFKYDFCLSMDENDDDDFYDFRMRRDAILARTREYIASQGITGDIKVWLTGYSRGAGIVNVTAARILEDPEGSLGKKVRLAPEDFYCYTYGTPNPASVSNDHKNSRYGYIHNVFIDKDFYSRIPPKAFGLDRYGSVHLVSSPDRKARMLSMLQDVSEDDYENYVAADPVNYTPLRLDTKALMSGELKFVSDDSSYLPYDFIEYEESVTKTFADMSAAASASGKDSRGGFARVYQPALMNIGEYLVSDIYDGNSAVVDSIMNNKKLIPFAFSLYMMFISDKHLKDSTENLNEHIEGAFNAFAELAENEDGTLKKDYRIISETYYRMRDLCFAPGGTAEQIDGIPQKYRLRFDLSTLAANKSLRSLFTKSIKNLSADLYASILGDALKESGYDQSVIDVMTSDADSSAVSFMLASMLFGNSCQSKKLQPFSLNNEQFKALATFAGNFSKLTAEHKGVALRSWLKTMDPNFDDYTPLTDAQKAGYRRVYVTRPAGVNVSGTVSDASGATVAEFVNGELRSSSDPWIRITTCDSGNWLRLPLDQTYTVTVTPDSKCRIGIRAAEYSTEEGAVLRTISRDDDHDWTAVNVPAGDEVTLTLPEITAASGEYSLPSNAEYSLTVPEQDANAASWTVAKACSSNNGNVTLTWAGKGSTDRYIISISEKGVSGSTKTKTVNGRTRAYIWKGLKKGRVYRCKVTAQKKALNGSSYRTASSSRTVYVIAGNVRGKYTNPGSVKLNRSSLTLDAGESFRLKAGVKKIKSSKKLLGYTAAVRYCSTDKKVASVSSKGVIRAKSKGSCSIYAQSVNGVWSRVRVRVSD